MILIPSCLPRQDASIHVYNDLEKSRSKFDLKSRRDPSCISVEAYWRDKHIETTFMSLAHLNLTLSAKTCWWHRWPQTTLAGSPVNTWPWVIMNGLRAHDPERITPYWCVGKDFNIPPLTHNGEVMSLTWLQVIDISKIRDIQIVGTIGLIKFWKLEKILLRTVAVARALTFFSLGYVIRPGDVTQTIFLQQM